MTLHLPFTIQEVLLGVALGVYCAAASFMGALGYAILARVDEMTSGRRGGCRRCCGCRDCGLGK